MRTITTLQNYYRLYLTNWKWWVIAVGGLPILILILIFDLIADSRVFLLFILRVGFFL
jgi:ABC-type dipeptide/oligopeptide/nickel transport system permease subunit